MSRTLPYPHPARVKTVPIAPLATTLVRAGREGLACEFPSTSSPSAWQLTQRAPVAFGVKAMDRDAVDAVDSSSQLDLSNALMSASSNQR